MSRKRDYTKFSNKEDGKVVNVVEEAVETSAAKAEAPVMEVEEVENVAPLKKGVVVDCLKLNVREAPNAKADVVCVVDASTNLEIDEAESTDDFYAVYTESGAEGYCMKQFIKIIP